MYSLFLFLRKQISVLLALSQSDENVYLYLFFNDTKSLYHYIRYVFKHHNTFAPSKRKRAMYLHCFLRIWPLNIFVLLSNKMFSEDMASENTCFAKQKLLSEDLASENTGFA